MKSLLRRNIFLIFLFSSLSFVSKASHIAGGQITYNCIGPNKYRVELSFYRDCGGIGEPTFAVIQYSSAACGVSSNISLSLQSNTDITPLCPGAESACGGSGLIGMEMITYVGTLQLPNGCSDWLLSYSDCCRNGAITNMTDAEYENVYVETTLNNTLSECNSSPQFASTPTLFGCVGETIHFQQLASDPDGDQLVYSLVNAENSIGSSVTYAGGFSGSSPFTDPVTIDANTGEIIVTPSSPQVAVIAVLVEEYRGGVLIGSVVRDLQINIADCSNSIPEISGVNGVAYSYSASTCVGGEICFSINLTDTDAGQSISAYTANLPDDATFNIVGSGNNVTATICWTPSIDDIGSHYFTLFAEDDACPLIGENSHIFEIVVEPNPNAPVIASNDVSICSGDNAILTATSSATNITSIEWSPSETLSSSSGASVTATPTATTTYGVVMTYADGCTSQDHVEVTILSNPVASVSPTTSSTCAGNSLMLTGTTDNIGMSFLWFNHSMASLGSGTVSGVSSTRVITTPSIAGSYDYTFQVTDPNTGCTSTAVSTVTVGIPPVLESCVNIYASPSGSAANPGTQASPTSLQQALSMAQCNNAVIKLAIGTYNINNALTIGSYVTLEGGFDPSNAWTKTSQAGATTINRTTLNQEGPTTARRLVAFYGNSVSGFRFQDLTITTSNPSIVSYREGVSTYGIHLTNCSDYDFVRCQILPGNAANGSGDNSPFTYNSAWDGASGSNGVNGITGTAGESTCNLTTDDAGVGGNGGNGGNGGLNATQVGGSAGNGGRGGNGGNGRPENSSLSGYFGTAGFTAVGGGNGGAGGAGGISDGNSGPTPYGGTGTNGTSGANGIDGTTGTPSHIAGFFIPANGTDGTAGRGGGGGGGGGGTGRDTGGCDASGSGGSGGGGGAGGGGAGAGAFGGGSSYGLYLYNNGTGGNVIQSTITAGSAGLGGDGGTGGNGGNRGLSNLGAAHPNNDVNRGGRGGYGGLGGVGGDGGDGADGQSINIYLNGGSAIGTNESNFNLASQPVIEVTNVNCTSTDVQYTDNSLPIGAGFASWDFDITTNNASPATGINNPDITQYTSVGRYSVSQGAETYIGFHNVSFDGSNEPEINTSATPVTTDVYQVCIGEYVNFESVYPAETYTWDFDGAITNPGSVSTVNDQFNTAGYYEISLELITDCCGNSNPKLIYLHVLETPTVSGSGTTSICFEESTTLIVNGLGGSDILSWSPLTNIESQTTNSLTVSPPSDVVYNATINASQTAGGNTVTGCPVTISFPITVNAIPMITMTSSSVICNSDGAVLATPSPASNYDFTWSNAFSTLNNASSNNTGLITGNYLVTVTDVVTGCQATDSAFVYLSSSLPNVYMNSNTPACGATATGELELSISGGTSPFSVTFDGTPNSPLTQSGLIPGEYLATITDDNGCTSQTTTQIPQLPQPEVEVTLGATLPCSGTDGVFYVEGSDGATFEYNLGSGNETIIVNHHIDSIIVPNITEATTLTMVSITDGCSVPLSSTLTLDVDPCGLNSSLTDFGVSCRESSIDLTWSVIHDDNISYFSLEGSSNGTDFEFIEYIEVKMTSSEICDYGFSYLRSSNEMMYFRLSQTNKNGNIEYLSIIEKDCNSPHQEINIYPNPSNGLFSIKINSIRTSESILINILDYTGKLVKEANYELNNEVNLIVMDAKSLEPGEYILLIKPEDSDPTRKKFQINY